ncbi:MAG TPA: hypothetical protein VJ644_08935 [Jiangellaceae bacterium]|nr:hypothetical protein [Jiangellaceae bacterium]
MAAQLSYSLIMAKLGLRMVGTRFAVINTVGGRWGTVEADGEGAADGPRLTRIRRRWAAGRAA